MNAIQRAQGRRIAAGFIAKMEGGMGRDGKFHAYWDPNGRVWTQGFGHTEGVGAHSKPWSLAKAKRVLRRDLAKKYGPPLDGLGWPGPHFYAAALSFVYNLGVGMLDRSHDFGRYVHEHNWVKAADSLDEYNESGGHVLPGLVTRRNAEQALARIDLKRR